MAKLEIEIGEVPGPIFTISCISESLCFPGSDAVYVNPTSRLALVGKCTQWCEDGELTYEWSLMSSEFDINTVSIVCLFVYFAIIQSTFRLFKGQ